MLRAEPPIDDILNTIKWVHAGLGAICLISGVVALTARKAKGRHPKSGRIFTVSLVLTYVAILMNIMVQKNVFMLGIGWLAVFAGAEGWRALLRFKGSLSPEPTALDRTLAGATALLALGLIVFGARAFISTSNVMGLVCAGFGLLGASLARGSWQRWKNPPSKPAWLALHIDMMTGAFSAALTAFLAIQLSGKVGGFEWVVWVAPIVAMSQYGKREKRKRGLTTQS